MRTIFEQKDGGDKDKDNGGSLELAGGKAFQDFIESTRSPESRIMCVNCLNDFARCCRANGLVVKSADDLLHPEDNKVIEQRIPLQLPWTARNSIII